MPVPGVTTYVYNARNRLEKVYLPDGRVATYSYDPFGRRVRKQVGNDVTFFAYADEGLVGEYDSAGMMRKSYGWYPGGLWETDPLYMVEEGDYFFYHNDHLGTPQRMTAAADGSVAWGAGYRVCGLALVDPSSTVENNLRFPGQYADAETGGHYNWNRYYDPVSGRYTQVDPIGFAGGDVNLYGYVWNRSLTFYDNRGLTGWSAPLPKGATSVISTGTCHYDAAAHNSSSLGDVFGGYGFQGGFHGFIAGVNGSSLVLVSSNGKICWVRTLCLRVGPGLYAGAGTAGTIGSSEGDPEDILEGFSWGGGADIGWGPSAGIQVTTSEKDGDRAVAAAAPHLGGGGGISVGLDFCWTKIDCAEKCELKR